MLDHLKGVLASKFERGEISEDILLDFDSTGRLLHQAVEEDDEQGIFSGQGRIEQLTLTHDRLYLETEEERKQAYAESRRLAQVTSPTWTSSPSSRFVSFLKGDFEGKQEVTAEERQSCVTSCAWSFAIIGMIVAISFLVADFWSSQANPALRTNLFLEESLTLPVVTFCSIFSMMPSFENYPTAVYPGQALFGVRSYSNGDTGEHYMFPETHQKKFKPVMVGPKDKCADRLKYMSVAAMNNAVRTANRTAPICLSCFEIGRDNPIVVSGAGATHRMQGVIRVELSLSRDLEYCYHPAGAFSSSSKMKIIELIKHHSTELVKRDIISLNGTSNVAYALDYGFEGVEDVEERIASVLCNIFLFSGYFYPVELGTDVRYHFNIDGGANAWREAGDGPFHKVKLSSRSQKTASVMNVTSMLGELKSIEEQRRDIFTSVAMFARDISATGPLSTVEQLDTVSVDRSDVIFFEKQIENGVSKFSWHKETGTNKMTMAVERFRRFAIAMDFSTFQVEVVKLRPTTSTAEFLTDIFEYAGLFTGVCAYSVLVGPARMYIKRLNVDAKVGYSK